VVGSRSGIVFALYPDGDARPTGAFR
jgi:hypothetical protein